MFEWSVAENKEVHVLECVHVTKLRNLRVYISSGFIIHFLEAHHLINY